MKLNFLDSRQRPFENPFKYLDGIVQAERQFRLKSLGLGPTWSGHLSDYYQSHVLPWTAPEEDSISKWLLDACTLIRGRCSWLDIPDHVEINLVKLPDGFDWDYPHTIQTQPSGRLFMVFHQSMIRPMGRDRDDHMLTCVHELIHICQRQPHVEPRLKRWYTSHWGFTWTEGKLHVPNPDTFNQITNPDGLNFQWITSLECPRTGDTIRMCPVLSHNGRRPVEILVRLDGNRVTDQWMWLSENRTYTRKFYGMTDQLHHPSEIFARLVSEYIVYNQRYTGPGSWDFYQFINSQ